MTIQSKAKMATMDTRELYDALQKVNLIKLNNRLPILSNVLAEFSNNRATFTTTDMERTIRTTVDSTADEDFSLLLPRKTTAKFLQGANGNLSVSRDKSDKVIVSRRSIGDLSFTANKVDDFPKIPPIPDNLEWHNLDGKWFCSMLRLIAIACAPEMSRPVLNGVACNDTEIAAADGFRLHYLKDDRLTFGLKNKQAIIPLDTVNLIIKLFRKEETIEIAFEKTLDNQEIKYVHFKSQKVALTSQLIQGSYPNYHILIPNTFKCKASFSAPLMAQRLNMIDPTALNGNIVRFIFETTEHGEQICSLQGGNSNETTYRLACPVKYEKQEVEEAKIAFSHKYFLDAIKSFSLCSLEITHTASPGKFTGDIEGLTIIVMPMLVTW